MPVIKIIKTKGKHCKVGRVFHYIFKISQDTSSANPVNLVDIR